MLRENDLGGECARLFFALWPDDAVLRELVSMVEQGRESCGGRAMRAETLHMTLLFLGSVPREQIVQAIEAAASVSAPAFTLKLQRIACWKHNRIAYAAPAERNDALIGLSNALRHAVEQAGLSFDRKVFAPHVTLLRNIDRCVDEQPVGPLRWRIGAFVLVESVPDEGRVRYQKLGSWTLT